MSAQGAINVRNKVSDLQSKLYHAAKQSLDRKFGALYDKIYREDVVREAYKRVRANHGAPGIDEEDFDYIEGVIGLDEFLSGIRDDLRGYRYKPEPVLRCYIEKPGRSDKRPLGIPVIRDRVIQTAAKLIIEPIFETNFLDCSYGFRPERSAHQAIEVIRQKIMFEHQRVVIDADLVGFFDNMNQDIIMDLVGRRINDPHILKLIRGWLEAGVMEDGEFIGNNGLGSPQGGVISPLLSNIYLHSFDKMFQLSGIRGTLVRYADDFVILLRGGGTGVLKQVEGMLRKLGLKIHPDKTRVVDAAKGFDFLGMHFRLRPVRKKDSKLKMFCQVWPSDRSMNGIKQKIKRKIGRRYSLSLEEIISDLNPVIRGYRNYHTVMGSAPKRRRRLNYFVHERLRIFLKRKYSDQTRCYKRTHGNLFVRLGLNQFA